MVIACASIGTLLSLGGCKNMSTNSSADIPIIDTHIHLYDTDRPEGVEWPPKNDKVLFRPVFPKHFNPICKNNGVGGVIIVEASTLNKDNHWVLDITESNPLYIGLVAFLDIHAEDFEKDFNTLLKNPRFVGIRLRRGTKTDNIITKTSLRNLKLLASNNKTLDILINNLSLEQVHEIATAAPKLKILINHLGGLTVDGKPLAEVFASNMRKLAALPNVHCKFSGIFQRTGQRPSPKDVAFYKHIFDEVFNDFGEDRLIYGSNWPVTDRGGKYSDQLGIITSYLKTKGDSALKKVMAGNAAKFYGVDIAK